MHPSSLCEVGGLRFANPPLRILFDFCRVPRAPQDDDEELCIRKRVITAPSFALSIGSASDALAEATTASGALPSRSSQHTRAKSTSNSGCGCTDSVVPLS